MTHQKEIIRWANSPDGTRVWCKEQYTNHQWILTNNAKWFTTQIYIVNDEYAKLRKAQTDGKIIQTSDELTAGGVQWSDIPNFFPMYKYPVDTFRIKPDEPIYYYQWEILSSDKQRIITSHHITDEYAEIEYKHEGWRKIESSKRTWDH